MRSALDDDSVKNVCVLLASSENRALLADTLRPRYEATFDAAELKESELEIDLCIVDGPSLNEHWDDLRSARHNQEPVLLPVLLLSNRKDVGLMTRNLWQLVDDVLLRPVEKLELHARIGALARARRLSLNLRRTNDMYEHERRVAQRFQEAAMPRTLPIVPGLSFDAFYKAGADEARVGGDWFDALRLADGRVVLSIGDVCGSGLDAAVAMASVRQVIRALAQVNPDPTLILEAAHRTLEAEDPDRIVTVFVGVFDWLHQELVFASAGHPRPLLRTPEGTVIELIGDGLPLGITDTLERERVVQQVPIGSFLLLYTDGLIEANRDILDGERVLKGSLENEQIIRAPNAAQLIFESCLPEGAHDDVALLVMRTAPIPPDLLRRWSFGSHDMTAAQAARAELIQELEKLQATAEEQWAAELVLGELVANVARYAPGTVQVSLDMAGSLPVLHVIDGGDYQTLQVRRPSDEFAERGRGLFLISSICRHFHMSEGGSSGGTHAIAVLPVSASRRRETN